MTLDGGDVGLEYSSGELNVDSSSAGDRGTASLDDAVGELNFSARTAARRCFLRRRSKKKARSKAMSARPPSVPPMAGPMTEGLLEVECVGIGIPEAETLAGCDVAAARKGAGPV